MRIFYDLVLTLDIILYSIEISLGTSPKERDFLKNVGMKSEPTNHEEISSSTPPKERDFLTNFGSTSEPEKHQDLSGMLPKERDFLSNFGRTREPEKHQELNSQFECQPNCDPVNGFPRGRPSFSRRHHTPERYLPSDDPPVRVRSRSPLARCMVPPTSLLFSDAIEYELNELEFIRLIPKANPHRVFGLRRYTFPSDASIKLRVAYNRYKPIPNQEQIVLSTSDGNVFAILENSDMLAGFYVGNGKQRMKVNMKSGTFTSMTRKEMDEAPVGEYRLITRNFKVEHICKNTPHPTFNQNNMQI